MTEQKPESSSDDDALDGLSSEARSVFGNSLRAAFHSQTRIDDAVDQQILANAKRRLDGAYQVRPRPTSQSWIAKTLRHPQTKWWLVATATAAALLLVVSSRFVTPHAAPRIAKSGVNPASGSLAREDLDRNGQVNILDAFLLAKQLKQGQTDASWDLNQDGRVNQADVRHAALLAVKLTSAATKG